MPAIRTRLDDLDTPCLVIDRDALDRNIGRISQFLAERGVRWRPHFKSYKSVELVRRVLAAGAVGVTCAKLGEAELLADHGVSDLLIVSPLAGRAKIERLVELRERADPIVVVDHVDHIVALEHAAARGRSPIRVVIEIDLGLQRCGVLPGTAAVELAQRIGQSPGLQFEGLMGWEGHLLTIADAEEKKRRIAEALQGLAHTRDMLRKTGIPCPTISAGGTGSYQITADLGIATEIEAGGGVLMDLFYREKCGVQGLEFALSVQTTVISRPCPERAVIDAGRKTLSPDLHLPAVDGRDDLAVQWLSAEHGVLRIVRPPGPAIGDVVRLIPGYGDWTTMLHDHYFVGQNGRLVEIWPLQARGRLD